MSFENLHAPEFRAALAADADGILLDVRTAAELAEAKIPGCIHLDVMQPDFSLDILDRHEKLFTGKSHKAPYLYRFKTT